MEDKFIGKVFGHCKISEKINEGGTAFIYKAFNDAFKLNRVVKILKPSLNDEEDFYIRFIQEAQLTARLDHPNILRVFDTGEKDGYYYIEMEYIEGRTLRTFISEKKNISERDILSIASQLVDALDYAHNVKIDAPTGESINGILHRDIKPENIMILPDKTVKLMDFGAAKPLNLTSNTMQGMIVGTFHYMSPEQISAEKLDSRSDYFSLGIVLYELFTGEKPFSSDKLVDLIGKIKSCKYKAPHKLRPAISPLSEELVQSLLERKKSNRPSSAKDIKTMINDAIVSFSSWGGGGKKIRPPFSFKKFYPTLSLIFSIIALLLSFYNFNNRNILSESATYKIEKKSSASLIDKARNVEDKKLWREAASIYEIVPSPDEGGIANEYLESRIKLAVISFKYLNQFTKARSILESLKLKYTDPAIDAYLGEIYFKLALYSEARDRIDEALNNKKGSIVGIDDEFKKELLYYYASSLDKEYTFVKQEPSLLRDAINAWHYYINFAGCTEETKNKDCSYAFSRLKRFEDINRKR